MLNTALCLDINQSTKIANVLMKLSHICSHPAIHGDNHLCERYGKLKHSLQLSVKQCICNQTIIRKQQRAWKSLPATAGLLNA